MNKFEMPKMNIAKFAQEDVVTTSNATIAAAKAAMGELQEQGVSSANIFAFTYSQTE